MSFYKKASPIVILISIVFFLLAAVVVNIAIHEHYGVQLAMMVMATGVIGILSVIIPFIYILVFKPFRE